MTLRRLVFLLSGAAGFFSPPASAPSPSRGVWLKAQEEPATVREVVEVVPPVEEEPERPVRPPPLSEAKKVVRRAFFAANEDPSADRYGSFTVIGRYLLEKGFEDYDATDVATLAWSFARGDAHFVNVFDKFADRAIELMRDFSTQELCDVAWAFAEAGGRGGILNGGDGTAAKDVFKELGDEVVIRLSEEINAMQDLTAADVASLLYNFHYAGSDHDVFFQEMAGQVLIFLPDFDCKMLTNIAVAFTDAYVDDKDKLYQTLAAQLYDQRFDQYFTKDMLKTIKAFYAAEEEIPKPLWRRMMKEIAETITDFDCEDLADAAEITAREFEAIATDETEPLFTEAKGEESVMLMEAMHEVEIEIEHKIRQMSCRQIFRIIEAWMDAYVRAPHLWHAVVRESVRRLHEFAAIKVSDAQDLTTLDADVPQLFEALLAQSTDDKKYAEDTTTWARWDQQQCDDCDVPEPEAGLQSVDPTPVYMFFGNFLEDKAPVKWMLYVAMALDAMGRLSAAQPEALASIARQFALANLKQPRLFQRFNVEVKRRASSFSTTDLATMYDAFAMANWLFDPSIYAFLESKIKPRVPFLSVQEKARLYLPALWSSLHFGGQGGFDDNMADLKDAYLTGKGSHRRRVPLRLPLVSDLCRDIGWFHRVRFTTVEGIDVDLAQPKTKQAVFVLPTGDLEPDGALELKVRVLKATGWRVTCLPGWVDQADAKHKAFLHAELFGENAGGSGGP